MFFESWASLARIALSAVIAYATGVAFLRISGKRTLAKMNAFDLVVTVALGSTLAALMQDGRLLDDAMRRERITNDRSWLRYAAPGSTISTACGWSCWRRMER